MREDEESHWLELLETMWLIRRFDEAAALLWLDGVVRGSVHEYIGQEAIAVGVCDALRREDYVVSYHRGHGHCIAKGVSVEAMMLELLGRVGGSCNGKGGSMHIADFSRGMLGANGVVGDGVTLAIGAAHSVRLTSSDRIVVAFFGDGAINRGPVMEALNWAVVQRLPLLFVCEDNRYSASTVSTSVTSKAGIGARVAGFGMEYVSVDGNDLRAVAMVAAGLVGSIRKGDGPQFLHAHTYRARGHLSFDKALYRPAGEAQAAWAGEPIERLVTSLRGQGTRESEIAAAETRASRRINSAIAAAREAPWPALACAAEDVQSIGAQTPWR